MHLNEANKILMIQNLGEQTNTSAQVSITGDKINSQASKIKSQVSQIKSQVIKNRSPV